MRSGRPLVPPPPGLRGPGLSGSRHDSSKTSAPITDGDSDSKTALDAVEASRLGAAQKTALRLLAEGRSYREAANAAGLRSAADLKRHAQRFGLVEAHNRARTALVAQEREAKTAAVIAELRQVAGKGTRELLRRLDQDPDSIQTRDLTVLTGVALDKIAKWERWEDGDQGEGHREQMAELLTRLTAAGNTVTLAVQPPEPLARAIDVTPRPDGPQ